MVSLAVAGCAGSAAVVSDAEPTARIDATASAQTSASAAAEVAASSAPIASAAPSAASGDRPAPGSPGELLMRDHFKQTVTIRQALIWGKLSNAVAPAESLASLDGIATLPKDWQVSVTQLTDAARRIRESSDGPEVAAATADIGRACGLCHTAAHGPSVKVDEPPAVDPSVASRMRRHQWASERLWEGMYVPSNPAWNAGAAALALDPFAGDTLKKGGVHARSAASRFNTQAKTLAQAKTNEARGVAYAELLSTCGPCHEAMGVKH